MSSGPRASRGGNAGIGNRSKRILFASLLLYYATLKVPRLNAQSVQSNQVRRKAEGREQCGMWSQASGKAM
jgi:hypothetical protein